MTTDLHTALALMLEASAQNRKKIPKPNRAARIPSGRHPKRNLGFCKGIERKTVLKTTYIIPLSFFFGRNRSFIFPSFFQNFYAFIIRAFQGSASRSFLRSASERLRRPYTHAQEKSTYIFA